MNSIEVLSSRVYDTKKSRINASERYKSWGRFIQLINIYYAISSMLLTIITYNKSSEKLYTYLLAFSVLIFTISIVTSSIDFKGKELSFKNDYILLTKIEYKLTHVNITQPNYQDILNQFEEQYTDILNSNENHSTLDYYKYLCTNTEKLHKKGVSQIIKICLSYYMSCILFGIIKIFFLLLPWIFGYLFDLIEIVYKF